MLGKTLQAILFVTFFLHVIPCYSFPLSTKKRWIIDETTGERVKLVCANWPSHVGPLLAEGLDKQPLNYIAAQVVKNKYNCIRLTWATFMFTRAQYAKLTVAESFDRLNLTEAKAGIAENNPFVLRMTLLQAFETVVDVLGSHGLMLVLDNHVSLPIWCCSDSDGNGFMNDPHFHPEEWIRGLTTVAKRFRGKSQVVGIGLRNELRGPRQNADDWYRYIQEAAKSIHELNPDVLLIASGLSYATNLTFLKARSLGSNFDNKLVLEAHLYSFSNAWVEQQVNKVCADQIQSLDDKVGFVINGENQIPLFFGEFGIKEKETSPAEERFLSCFSAYAIARDLDWGLWALQGSYYFRENVTNMEEYYGILDINWSRVRNPQIQERLRLMKTKIQDSDKNSTASYIMYHPQTGSCIRNKKKEIYASTCNGGWSKWIHDGNGAPIRLTENSSLCLKAVGDGVAPILSTDCLSPQSTWTSLSVSKLHLAAKDDGGEFLCLHMESSKKIVTRKCICVWDDPNCKDDSTSQWFELALTNV
ncbi:unnamed protein product [Dovyalis caffra]|uniref:Glycoside hydrolase family 5 domain-containing protein n=1 Tax=Dovyalis caffra TaxID=77055 RepID=A0AAV1RFT4_9ROSI|nr:unnamed protein product [Dovyalis caffra]